MSSLMKCPQCGATVDLTDEIKSQIMQLLHENKQQAAELTILASAYEKIRSIADFEKITASNVFLKIPKIISQFQREQDAININTSEIIAIIDKHKPVK